MSRPIRILIFAGPSGGHLFPAYAYAEALRKRYADCHLHLVTGQRAKPLISNWDRGLFNQIHYLHDFPFPRGISLRTLGFLI